MGLTPSQQNAVDVRGRTLLVSAAAGSGKTYTLTQRIIKAIIEDGQDLSRLLIVTFTRAAAGELKAKISKALSAAIAEHPENIHLQKQLIKLGQAHISTIDSFFSEPVRANFEKLGLPASMRLSDEAELTPIRDKIMQQTLDIFFGHCEPFGKTRLSPVGYKNDYTDLIDIISSARDQSNILPTFFDIYGKLITSPIGLEQLKRHADRLKDNSQKDYFDTLEGKVLRAELTSLIKSTWKTFIKCSEEMQDDQFVASKYTSDFIDNASAYHELLSVIESASYSEAKASIDSFKAPKITSIKEAEKTERSEYYKNLRAKLNKKIKSFASDRMSDSQKKINELFLAYGRMCILIYEILSRFDKAYLEEKKRRGICEFSDMPKFMLSLLTDENNLPTDYARTLAESFDEVYIDEYQDVNEIQDTIFAIIGGNRRFMVGDIKQSIYGFREAEPSIFAGYRRKYPIYNKDEERNIDEAPDGSTIFMSENFRCDENVISFTNSVCSDVFSAFSESIGYTSDDDLKFGKAVPSDGYVSPKVKLNIIETPCKDELPANISEVNEAEDENERDGTLTAEAVVTANEIAELIRNHRNADGSRITPGNIAVLVRSNTSVKPLLNALGSMKIKYILSSKGELFETADMRLLVDLLTVIDNPRSDIPLYHVLTAKNDDLPPYFSLEEVVMIRNAANRSVSLYDAVISCSTSEENELCERCRSFISSIEKMRRAAGVMSADKLIKGLISSERYASLAKTDAFTYLYDSACRYVKTTWSSLYSFIGYFKELMENGEGGSEPDPNVSDAVRIMTIHQSKGLEFNVCFIFGAGRRFNTASRTPFIFNKEFGPSMKLPPSDGDDIIENISVRCETNTIYKSAGSFNKYKQLEEEARIFYVALTRARERLYISATLSKPFADYMEKIREGADSEYEIKNSSSYIRWILLTVASGKCSDDIFNLEIHDRYTASATAPFAASEAHAVKAVSEKERTFAELIASAKDSSESNARLSNIPAKAAASKVSSHMLDDSVFMPIPTGLLFSENDDNDTSPESENSRRIKARIELMRSSRSDFDSLLEVNKKPTAAEIGTATHAFLQFCDYANIEQCGLEAEIERLKAQKFITERTAGIINRAQIGGFFKSELYGIIRNARQVRREFHFGMFRDASEFTESDEMKKLVLGKKIFVQGSIDLIIELHDGSILLCDYKTDHLTLEEKNDPALLTKTMQEKHGEQLKQYSYAVKEIFGKEPDGVYIYSLSLRDAIKVN